MTQTGKTEKAVRQLAVMSTMFTGIVIAATGAWAFILPSPPGFPAVGITAPPAPISAVAAFDARPWQVNLWRPLSDTPAPIAPPPPPPPITFKVFSILKQNNGLTAVIDPGAGGGLLYVKSGEKIGEYAIINIDARGIEIEVNGLRQRLEMAP